MGHFVLTSGDFLLSAGNVRFVPEADILSDKINGPRCISPSGNLFAHASV
jgi:hypothetical protein